MKRPVSILCMADMHYEKGNMNALEQLHSDYKKYVDENVEHQRWNPDYIVIAGDVIDWTAQYDSNKYDHAKKNVENLVRDFGIDAGHVIIVPGNHDNMISTDVKIKELDRDRTVFERFCNDEKGYVSQEFKHSFLSRFNDYTDFCEQYMKGTEFHDNSILDEKLRCLAGVKSFETDHLCFVIVNTEWLYIPKDPFEKHIEAYVSEGISTHMKLYEKCQLCTPLVKDAFQLIKSKYADYTVVTVMHRGFEDLTWKENNASDKLNIDAIDYLKSISDIILTGHDHTIKSEPPTLINNRIQHFRLGSVGRKEPKTREYIRTASIIRFSPIEGEIELLNMEYVRDKEVWSFHPHKRTYPLFSKYEKIAIKNFKNDSDTFIRAKGGEIEDIENAIKQYFRNLPDSIKSNMIIIDANDVVKKGLDEYVTAEDYRYIVIYYIYSDVFLKGHEVNNIRRDVKDKIIKFQEQNIVKVLTNKIIIGEIFVEKPTFDILETTFSK